MLGTQHGQVVIILQLCMEKKKSNFLLCTRQQIPWVCCGINLTKSAHDKAPLLLSPILSCKSQVSLTA